MLGGYIFILILFEYLISFVIVHSLRDPPSDTVRKQLREQARERKAQEKERKAQEKEERKAQTKMPIPNDNSQEQPPNTSFKKQKPNYKRFDLTITIPDSPDVKKTVRIDPAGNFLESYFKEQCFPIGLGFEKKSYSGYARSTVWNVVFSVESIFMLFLLDSDIDIEGYAKAAVIPGLVCLASLPVSGIITPLLRRSVRNT